MLRDFPTTALDLASDQCTVYLAGYTSVERFNICSGTFLGTFATLDREYALAVRVLPDCDVLVGGEGRLARFDVNGVMVRSYPLPDRERGSAMMLRDGGSRLLYGENTSCEERGGRLAFGH